MMRTEKVILHSKQFLVGGHALRRACLYDESWVETSVEDQLLLAASLQDQDNRFDLFSFVLPLPNSEPAKGFHIEWDNAAVAKTADYSEWWESLPQESRKNVRRSQRRGVTVRQVEFNERLVSAISAIYNESPIRQGRKFWHYGKPLAQVKEENSSYLDRSIFIGAFLEEELIGFIKFVKVGSVGRIMQILCKDAHVDKRPTNALIAKAIEICAEMKLSHFIYGQYVYGNKENSPMTEFKKRNGFSRLNFPRHYLPLSIKGYLYLKLGFHRGLRSKLPEPLITAGLTARSWVLERVYQAQRRPEAIGASREIAEAAK